MIRFPVAFAAFLQVLTVDFTASCHSFLLFCLCFGGLGNLSGKGSPSQAWDPSWAAMAGSNFTSLGAFLSSYVKPGNIRPRGAVLGSPFLLSVCYFYGAAFAMSVIVIVAMHSCLYFRHIYWIFDYLSHPGKS